MVKAVFFDIDGTLVSFNTHRVPESAKRAVIALQKKGIKVFIATGRHLNVIDNLDGLKFDGYITLNGSCCYVDGDKEVIYQKAISRETISDLIRYQTEKETFPCIFVREQDMFINYLNEQTGEVFRLLNFPEPPVCHMREALNGKVLQLIAFFEADQQTRIMEALPGCEATRWNTLFTDVVPEGGSKRVGMEKILAHYHISSDECMAFGDGGNDIPMLQYAGIGIAMGKARQEVREQADFITRDVDEDGIEFALHHFGLLSD